MAKGTFNIKAKGLQEAIKAAGDLAPMLKDAAYDAVAETAANGEGTVKEIHRQGGRGATGLIYKRGKTVTHRASSPRNPPAPDTGTLLGSITHQIIRPGYAWIGSRLRYAQWLEWGTPNMKPRPMWRPASKIIQRDFDKQIRAAIEKVIK